MGGHPGVCHSGVSPGPGSWHTWQFGSQGSSVPGARRVSVHGQGQDALPSPPATLWLLWTEGWVFAVCIQRAVLDLRLRLAQSWGWRGKEGSGRLPGATPSAWVLLRPLARCSLLLAPSVNCLPPILSRPLGHHQRRDRRSGACFILVGTVSVSADFLVPVVLCLLPRVILTIAPGAILVLSPFQRRQSGAGGGLLHSSDAEMLGYTPCKDVDAGFVSAAPTAFPGRQVGGEQGSWSRNQSGCSPQRPRAGPPHRPLVTRLMLAQSSTWSEEPVAVQVGVGDGLFPVCGNAVVPELAPRLRSVGPGSVQPVP